MVYLTMSWQNMSYLISFGRQVESNSCSKFRMAGNVQMFDLVTAQCYSFIKIDKTAKTNR